MLMLEPNAISASTTPMAAASHQGQWLQKLLNWLGNHVNEDDRHGHADTA